MTLESKLRALVAELKEAHKERMRNPPRGNYETGRDAQLAEFIDKLEALLAERQEPPALAAEGLLQKSQREASDAAEKADCEKALLALAGWYPTPVAGYGFNTSWAISDLCRAIYQLRAAAPSSGTGERK